MLGLAAIGATAQTQVGDNDLTNAYTFEMHIVSVWPVTTHPSWWMTSPTLARLPIIYMALT